MGIGKQTYSFLKYFCSDIDFGDCCTFGRPHLYLSDNYLTKESIQSSKDEFSEKLLINKFSAKSVKSLDYSAFEGSDIVLDLNYPIEKEYFQLFDTVFNFGTLEHVFDVRTAFENFVNLVKPGGHCVSVMPCNNYVGHGFYQFSPEFFFQFFSLENGFENVEVYIAKNKDNGKVFYRCLPPPLGVRLLISSLSSLTIFVRAQRSASGILPKTIYQSDYVEKWSSGNTQSRSGIGKIKKVFPKIIYRFGLRLYGSWRRSLMGNKYTVKIKVKEL